MYFISLFLNLSAVKTGREKKLGARKSQETLSCRVLNIAYNLGLHVVQWAVWSELALRRPKSDDDNV